MREEEQSKLSKEQMRGDLEESEERKSEKERAKRAKLKE